MNLSFNPQLIKTTLRKVSRPLFAHAGLFAILAITCYLILGILQVNQILQQPSDEAYQLEQQKNAVKTRFDATTIGQIEKLKSRQEASNLALPSGKRINPFNE